jgi:hypothetical protein
MIVQDSLDQYGTVGEGQDMIRIIGKRSHCIFRPEQVLVRDFLDVDRYNSLIKQIAEYFSGQADNEDYSNEIILNILPASNEDTFESTEYDFIGL